MKRIALFMATNIAVLVVLSIVLSVLGVDSLLQQNNVDLDMQALLVFSAVFVDRRQVLLKSFQRFVSMAEIRSE